MCSDVLCGAQWLPALPCTQLLLSVLQMVDSWTWTLTSVGCLEFPRVPLRPRGLLHAVLLEWSLLVSGERNSDLNLLYLWIQTLYRWFGDLSSLIINGFSEVLRKLRCSCHDTRPQTCYEDHTLRALCSLNITGCHSTPACRPVDSKHLTVISPSI